MKKLFLFIMLLGIDLAHLYAQNQQDINPKIDNQGYWRQMITLGRVQAEPYIRPRPAKFLSDMILAENIVEANYPDVAIIEGGEQTENSIFVDPNNPQNLINSNNSLDRNNNFWGTSNFRSSDGAESWQGSAQAPAGVNRGDPSVVIDNDGNQYIGYININGGQSIAISNDGGQNWNQFLIAASQGIEILDKNHLWIDNQIDSPNEGNLYNAWTPFRTNTNLEQIEFSRSVDGGQNWSNPINISAAAGANLFHHGVNINTGPNGEVYAVWAIYFNDIDGNLAEDAIGFARSLDGGRTFEPAQIIRNNIKGIRRRSNDNNRLKNMRTNSFPVLAVDRSGGENHGNLYVVWSNIGEPGINNGPDIDIYIIKSTDNGRGWSDPIRVNQDPQGLGKVHYMPWITCDPITGVLGVVFYDDRNLNDLTQVQTYAAISEDGGENWVDFRVSDVAFSPQPVPGSTQGYFGDYLGITANNGIFYPVWTDNRTGTALTYVSPFVINICDIEVEEITLQNEEIRNGQEIFEEAMRIQIAGAGTHYSVASGARVTLRVTERAIFRDGFTAEEGCVFRAYAEGCFQNAGRNNAIPIIQENQQIINKETLTSDFFYRIAPNPNEGIFKLILGDHQKIKKGQDLDFMIYDLMGKNVYHKILKSDGSNHEINISHLQKGVYVTKLIQGEVLKVKRLVIR